MIESLPVWEQQPTMPIKRPIHPANMSWLDENMKEFWPKSSCPLSSLTVTSAMIFLWSICKWKLESKKKKTFRALSLHENQNHWSGGLPGEHYAGHCLQAVPQLNGICHGNGGWSQAEDSLTETGSQMQTWQRLKRKCANSEVNKGVSKGVP